MDGSMTPPNTADAAAAWVARLRLDVEPQNLEQFDKAAGEYIACVGRISDGLRLCARAVMSR